MSLTATPPAGLEATLAARRTPEQLKASRALLWRDRLTSLWMPLIVLLVAYVPYLPLIEFAPSAASWAQPVMQYLALLLLVAFLGLIAWRLVVPRERILRGLRHDARELMEEIVRIHKRVPGKISAEASVRLAEQTMQGEDPFLPPDPDRNQKQNKTPH